LSVGLKSTGQLVAKTGLYSSYNTTTTTATINDGNWHHVVVDFAPGGSSGVATIYLDGQVADTAHR
jgi:hypothetical protein